MAPRAVRGGAEADVVKRYHIYTSVHSDRESLVTRRQLIYETRARRQAPPACDAELSSRAELYTIRFIVCPGPLR